MAPMAVGAGLTTIGLLEAMAERFQGVDLQRRRSTSCSAGAWPSPWRARLRTSKNERREYRMTVYADTADDAIMALYKAVWRIDNPVRAWP